MKCSSTGMKTPVEPAKPFFHIRPGNEIGKHRDKCSKSLEASARTSL